MSEADLYRPIIEAARAAGLATLVRIQAGRARVRGGWMHLATPGTPDLCGWMLRGPKRGAFVGLEVKKPGEKPTPIQSERRAEIEAAGGVAAIVHDVAEALGVLQRAALNGGDHAR